MSLYETMIQSFPQLIGFDGGFIGMGVLAYMPIPPGCLGLLVGRYGHLRELRMNTHAYHQELFETLRQLPCLEELTLEEHIGDGHTELPLDNSLSLPNLELLVVFFQRPDSPLLLAIERWILPSLTSLFLCCQGTRLGDVAPVLARHGQGIRQLELSGTWHKFDAPIDLNSCPNLTTLAIDWCGQPPTINGHIQVTQIYLHHSTGPVPHLDGQRRYNLYNEPLREVWPFDHFLGNLHMQRGAWPCLTWIIDTSLYHPSGIHNQ
ncbi:hypothetical protein M422DRAFT_248682 [Sphaerobolus stellatus SS14]|nr:hypothetical protein M422DRAFT_248682 [Sphaerobolus stellatus SS14]